MMPNKFYDVLLDGSSSGQDKSQQAEEYRKLLETVKIALTYRDFGVLNEYLKNAGHEKIPSPHSSKEDAVVLLSEYFDLMSKSETEQHFDHLLQEHNWNQRAKSLIVQPLPQKEDAGTGQIEFHGPAQIADGMEGYVAVFNKLKLVETGVTKQEALNEIVISFAVLVAYQAELKVPDFIPRKDAGQQREGKFKNRMNYSQWDAYKEEEMKIGGTHWFNTLMSNVNHIGEYMCRHPHKQLENQAEWGSVLQNISKDMMDWFSVSSQGEDAGYWKERCEAAELILFEIGINTKFNIANPENNLIEKFINIIKKWQSLKNQ